MTAGGTCSSVSTSLSKSEHRVVSLSLMAGWLREALAGADPQLRGAGAAEGLPWILLQGGASYVKGREGT